MRNALPQQHPQQMGAGAAFPGAGGNPSPVKEERTLEARAVLGLGTPEKGQAASQPPPPPGADASVRRQLFPDRASSGALASTADTRETLTRAVGQPAAAGVRFGVPGQEVVVVPDTMSTDGPGPGPEVGRPPESQPPRIGGRDPTALLVCRAPRSTWAGPCLWTLRPRGLHLRRPEEVRGQNPAAAAAYPFERPPHPFLCGHRV